MALFSLSVKKVVSSCAGCAGAEVTFAVRAETRCNRTYRRFQCFALRHTCGGGGVPGVCRCAGARRWRKAGQLGGG